MLEQKIEQYINGDGFNDNASEGKSHTQMATRVGTEAIKEYILNKVVSFEAKEAHLAGQIYIHNLDHLGGYCNSVDPTIPLTEGLNLPTVKANPSKHLTSAIDHLYAYLMFSQAAFSGAQSIDWVNWFLAPYMHVDNLSDREIEDCIQRWFFNCNQVTRTGGKPPFINMGLRMNCPKPLRERIAKVNGKEVAKYGDLQLEAAKIYNIVMKVLRQGMAGGIPFTYPLVATAVESEKDFESELWMETCKTIAHNGSVYIVNLLPNYMQANGDCDIVSSQCCRVRTKFAKVSGIWSGGEMGTGSNRIITLNIARLALDAKAQGGDFFELLHERLELIRQTLLELNLMVFNSIYKWDLNSWLKQKTPDGIPYYDFRNRRLLVGVAFVHDMLIHLGYVDKNWKPLASGTNPNFDRLREETLNIPKHGLLDKEGLKEAMRIFEAIRKILERWSEEDGVQYGIEAPPNESSNHYMCERDIKQYGEENVSWYGTCVNDAEYAPATHLPYHLKIPMAERVKIEQNFHRLCDGGNIFHLWIGEGYSSVGGIKELMEGMAKNTDLSYWAVSPKFDICAKGHCTRSSGSETCSTCGDKIIDHMDRIVGYMERTSKFNPSKKTEQKMRVRY